MALKTDRFVVVDSQVVGVSRTDTIYERRVKGKPAAGDEIKEAHNYHLEITLYDHNSMYIDYDEDKAARDAAFEAVAAVIP